MASDISDVLDATIAGYLGFFENMATFGGAVFGATLFLVVRHVGIIRDDDLAPLKRGWVVMAAGLFGLATIALNFVAQNFVLAFHTEMLLGRALDDACYKPFDPNPLTHFRDCYRTDLRNLVRTDLVFGGFAMLLTVTWFVGQAIHTGRLENEARNRAANRVHERVVSDRTAE